MFQKQLFKVLFKTIFFQELVRKRMAKVISKDADLKSLLIEIIEKHNDLSLWVFDELINNTEIQKQYQLNVKLIALAKEMDEAGSALMRLPNN